MNEKTAESIKAIDMKRAIQEQLYEETRDMTPDEVLAYVHARIAASRFADFLATPTAQPSATTEVQHDL